MMNRNTPCLPINQPHNHHYHQQHQQEPDHNNSNNHVTHYANGRIVNHTLNDDDDDDAFWNDEDLLYYVVQAEQQYYQSKQHAATSSSSAATQSLTSHTPSHTQQAIQNRQTRISALLSPSHSNNTNNTIHTANSSHNNSTIRNDRSSTTTTITPSTNRYRLSLKSSLQYSVQPNDGKNLIHEMNNTDSSAAASSTASDEEDENICSICLEKIVDGASLSHCRHIYCLQCILHWSSVTNACPQCRTSYTYIQHTRVLACDQNTGQPTKQRINRIDVEERKQSYGDDEDDDDGAYDHYLCEVCHTGDNEDILLICEEAGCGRCYHIYCLRPRLLVVPTGQWKCNACLRAERLRHRNANVDVHTLRNQQRNHGLQRQRRGHSYNNDGISGIDAENDRRYMGYSSDDGFVVDDDTIIYATQHPSNRSNNNGNGNRDRSGSSTTASNQRQSSTRRARGRSSRETGNRRNVEVILIDDDEDDEYRLSDDGTPSDSDSSSTDSASEHSDEFESTARTRRRHQRRPTATRDGARTERRQASRSTGAQAARSTRSTRCRSGAQRTSGRSTGTSIIDTITRHANQLKRSDTFPSTSSPSSSASGSRSRADRTIQATMSQVFQRMNSNTGNSNNNHCGGAQHPHQNPPVLPKLPASPRSSAPSSSTQRRPYTNSTFPVMKRDGEANGKTTSSSSSTSSSRSFQPPSFAVPSRDSLSSIMNRIHDDTPLSSITNLIHNNYINKPAKEDVSRGQPSSSSASSTNIVSSRRVTSTSTSTPASTPRNHQRKRLKRAADVEREDGSGHDYKEAGATSMSSSSSGNTNGKRIIRSPYFVNAASTSTSDKRYQHDSNATSPLTTNIDIDTDIDEKPLFERLKTKQKR